jgi:hypothetical protein
VVDHRRPKLDDLWLRRLSLERLVAIPASYQPEMVEIVLDLGRMCFLIVMAGLRRVTTSTRQMKAVRHGRVCQWQAGWLWFASGTFQHRDCTAEDRCDEATGWWQKWDLLRQVAGRLVCTGRGGADREQEGAGDVEGDQLGRWALGAV